MASRLGKVPVLGTALKMVPGLGAGLAVADMAMSGYDLYKGATASKMGKSLGGGLGLGESMGQLVPLSKAQGMSLPSLRLADSSGPARGAGGAGGAGSSGGHRGKRSLSQLSLADLQAMDAAGEHIPASQLRTYHKSPVKGYVVMSEGGAVFCLRKDVARRFGWKPGHKPPISVGAWHAIKKAGKAVDKFHHVEKEAAKLMHFKHHIQNHHAKALPGKGMTNIIIEKKGK